MKIRIPEAYHGAVFILGCRRDRKDNTAARSRQYAVGCYKNYFRFA
jgi:hypothetical protein